MKRWSLGLIALGLLLVSYPTLSDAYEQWQLQRVLVGQLELEPIVSIGYGALQNVLTAVEEAESEVVVAVPETQKKVEWAFPVLSAADAGRVLGVLRIESVGLEVPIYAGSGDMQLQQGVGQMIGTGGFGEIGNAVLAGHRRTFFRDLDKLEPGDEIIIETEQGFLRYQVYKLHIVEPSNLSVLNRNRRYSLLTLITCHPLYTSKQRLVVHAYLVANK